MCKDRTMFRRLGRGGFSSGPSLVAGWKRDHGFGGCSHSHGASLGVESASDEQQAPVTDGMRRECRVVTLVGGASNVGMAIVKIFLGSTGGSFALLADGFHALVDFASDVVSYTCVALSSRRMARCRFPFGLGRIETSGAVVVAGILLAGGAGLMWASASKLVSDFRGDQTNDVKSAEDHHRHDGCSGDDHHHGHSHSGLGHSHFTLMSSGDDVRSPTVLWQMVWVALGSLVLKEWLFRWTKRAGDRARSRVVVANAYHHRADAWSSGVALIGVGGYLIGFPALDAVAGLVVSFSIAKIGYDLLRDSLLEFFDFQYTHDVRKLRGSIKATLAHLDPPVVNVFATRHGHSYVLHATFLAEEKHSVHDCARAVKELKLAAGRALLISETFVNFIPVLRTPRNDNASDELLLSRFKEALESLESFHGFKIESVITEQTVDCSLGNGHHHFDRDDDGQGASHSHLHSHDSSCGHAHEHSSSGGHEHYHEPTGRANERLRVVVYVADHLRPQHHHHQSDGGDCFEDIHTVAAAFGIEARVVGHKAIMK